MLVIEFTCLGKKLATSYATLLASPGYLDAAGIPTHPSDLKVHKKIAMGDSPNASRWDLFDANNSHEFASTEGATLLNDLTMIHQLAIDGGGIASLPIYMSRRSLASGNLVEALPDWRSRAIPIYCVYPSHRSMTLKLRVWIDYLAGKLPSFDSPPLKRAS